MVCKMMTMLVTTDQPMIELIVRPLGRRPLGENL